MRRFPTHYLLLPLLSAVLVMAILATVRIVNPRALARRALSGPELLDQVVGLVRERYIREVDTGQEIWFDAIRGIVEGLDPYSRFYGPREKEGFEEETEGKFGGIGVAVWIPEDGGLYVNYPILGGPAGRAAIRPCDRIVAVDGESLGPIETREDREHVIERLRGEPGTPVTLAVLSEGETEPREITVVRESIAHRSVVGVGVLDPRFRIGYLHIKGFQETTVEEFDDAVRGLQRDARIRALIVDLRFNPGGILNAAVRIADRFLDSGIIVSTRGRSPRARKVYSASAEDTLPADLALVILVNRESASASEVLAGAIQDQRRGILVGEPTYGKGVVQNVLYLNGERAVLKLTSAAYFTPSGRCIERRVPVPGTDPVTRGITPDFLVRDRDPDRHLLEMHLARARPGEDFEGGVEPCFPPEEEGHGIEDPQLDAAIRLLRGEPPAQSLVRAQEPQGETPAPGGER